MGDPGSVTSLVNPHLNFILLSARPEYLAMSDTFRKAVTSRLTPLPPTRAPWAEANPSNGNGDDEDEEELEEGDSMGELSAAYVSFPSSS
jgi:hypothetical protein